MGSRPVKPGKRSLKEDAMGNKPKIMNLDEVEITEFGKGEKFRARTTRIGEKLGMKQAGCSLVELDPGKRAWPYHLHFAQEEFFIILAGQGTLRYDGEEYPVRAGDMIFAPTGQGTAHQIVNTSGELLRYLAMSSASSTELCYYPDSGKYGAYSKEPRFAFIAREASGADYWEGEQ